MGLTCLTSSNRNRIPFGANVTGNFQARAEAELGAALAGERLRRDGELTEIKSVVDEMMTLDPSASGGGIAGVTGSLFGSPRGRRGARNFSGIVNVDGNSRGADTVARHSSSGGSSSSYRYSRAVMGGSGGRADGETSFASDNTALLHRGGGGLVWRSALANNTTANDGDHHRMNSGSSSSGGAAAAAAAARLAEAWSLLEASEAARRRLSEEVKGWADRTASLESALAAAEATAESRAREARLMAASLQDATDGLALEEAARREAEGRADALR